MAWLGRVINCWKNSASRLERLTRASHPNGSLPKMRLTRRCSIALRATPIILKMHSIVGSLTNNWTLYHHINAEPKWRPGIRHLFPLAARLVSTCVFPHQPRAPVFSARKNSQRSLVIAWQRPINFIFAMNPKVRLRKKLVFFGNAMLDFSGANNFTITWSKIGWKGIPHNRRLPKLGKFSGIITGNTFSIATLFPCPINGSTRGMQRGI